MFITLSPQRRDDELIVIKVGEVLTINDEVFDFSDLPDGATIPAGDIPCEWIAGPVHRQAGQLQVTLILPHGPDPSQRVAFPEPITNPPDGLLDLPVDPPIVALEQAEDEENVEG